MLSAVLAMLVIWCLLYGRLQLIFLIPACSITGFALAFLNRHKHTQFLTIDVLAQMSRLNGVNPDLKFWTVIAWMALSVGARTPFAGIFLTAAVPLIVCAGGLRARDYVRLLTLPASFLLISAIALLFEVSAYQNGVLGVAVFGVWFCVSAEAQLRALLIMARAFGAVSSLYLLSLTTPMSELIGVLRRAHCPDIFIELMYLIYRYIFILLSMYHTMRDAAGSRLGTVNYRTSVKTTGNLYSNLLSRSYRQAGINFDAMESRCYDAGIEFLETKKKVSAAQACVAAGITALTVCLSFLLK